MLSLGSVILTVLSCFSTFLWLKNGLQFTSFPIINHQFDAALSEYLRDQNEINWSSLIPTWYFGKFNAFYIWSTAMWGGWGSALQARRKRVRLLMVSLELFIHIIFPVTLWPWGNLASNRNGYQEYFLGIEGGQCVGLTTLPIFICWPEIWDPQTPGTLWVCPDL